MNNYNMDILISSYHNMDASQSDLLVNFMLNKKKHPCYFKPCYMQLLFPKIKILAGLTCVYNDYMHELNFTM